LSLVLLSQHVLNWPELNYYYYYDTWYAEKLLYLVCKVDLCERF
jgi:hypothetical protein